MRVSVLPDPFREYVSTHDYTWETFARSLTTHQPHPGPKEQLPCWSPAEFEGGRRLRSRVLAVHCAVAEFDKLPNTNDAGVPDSVLADTIATLEGFRWRSVVYSTWSNPRAREAGKWRYRVVVDLSRPILAEEWAAFWPTWCAVWPACDSKSAKDAAHIYFAPFVHEATPANGGNIFAWQQDGQPLDVDTFIQRGLAKRLNGHAHKLADRALQPIKLDTIRTLVRKLKRSRHIGENELGERLGALVDGEPFANHGERDDTIWRMCVGLAKRLPNAEPSSVAALFYPSLDMMNRSQTPFAVWPNVEDKFRRALETQLQAQQAIAEEFANTHKARVREALGDNRSEGYSPDELASFRAQEQCDESQFRTRWLIQYGDSWYFYVNGQYSPPYPSTSAQNAVIRDLAPAHTAGVELYELSNQGTKTKRQLGKLVELYGSVARHCDVDLTSNRTYYDAERCTMVEAAASIDPTLEAKADARVDQWLRALAGSKYELLVAWLSWVTELTLPCVALFLTGPPGTGKSLLASGLARLWSASPTPMGAAMGQFNSALAQCPLVFADEALPRDIKGITTELREFIQARQRSFRRKYLPDSNLKGAVRCILAANSPSMLSFQEDLSSDDIAAIAERFLHVHCHKEARAVLALFDHTNWVDEGVIAQHVLYLTTQRKQPDGRFLVKDPDPSIYRALSTKTGARMAVCKWLVSYLVDPVRVDSTKKLLVRTLDRKLLVTPKGVEDNWTLYHANERVPSTHVLEKTIKALSHGDYVMQAVDGSGFTQRYRSIDIDLLEAWALDTEYAMPSSFRRTLERNSEERVRV